MNRAVACCLAAALLPAAARADEAVERRLYADQVASSSFLWNDWNRFQENYHPLYVSDGDPRTAWTEGAKNDGPGEWIRLQVTPMEGATRLRLRVRAGYQKTQGLFKANARPKEMTITLLPSGKAQKVAVADAWDWQEFTVEQPAGKLDEIEIKIDSVYPGSKYSDLCISDVELYVTATTGENPAFEKSKLGKVLAWKQERLDAAKLFKQASSQELPLLPAYKLVTSEGKEGLDLWSKCESDQLCWTKEMLGAYPEVKAKHGEAVELALAALAEKGTVPTKLAPADKRPLPAVDGLHIPDVYQSIEHDFGYNGVEMPVAGSVASLHSDKLGVLQLEGKDIKADRAKALAAKAPGCKSKKGTLYSWMLRDKSGEGRDRVRALVFVRCERVEMRDGFDDEALLQVAVYDAEGRLELTAGAGYVTTFSWTKKDTGEVLGGALALYDSGNRGELTGPEVAAATP